MSNRRFEIFATAFDKKRRVIGSGVNSYSRTHPLSKYFSIKAGMSEERVFVHGELAAILSAGRKQIHTLLVQRFDRNGNMVLAKPCPSCMLMIQAFGIKIIQYTDEGIIKEMKVDEFTN